MITKKIQVEPTTCERPIYGSSRLGIMNKAVVFNLTGGLVSKSNSTIGIKEYELSDHLGNVSVVVLDRKNSLSTNIQPVIISNTDYYPFGYPIRFRTHSTGYRYGFNGQEGDNEIYGDKLDYAFTYRMYDSRIGRFWSVDPLRSDYPWNSTYAFAENSPIAFLELEGLERYYAPSGRKLGLKGTDNSIRIIKDEYLKDFSLQKSESYLKTISEPFHNTNEIAQRKVASTVYKEIENIYSLKTMNVDYTNEGTAASTNKYKIGDMTIYPKLTSLGEFLNDDYYNQSNFWVHEKNHKILKLGGDAFSEFQLNIIQMNHWTYNKTTPNFKFYLRNVMLGNLRSQYSYLADHLLGDNKMKIYKSPNFQYYMKLYNSNVKLFYKLYNANEKEFDPAFFIPNFKK